jgi:hypothetical protein
MRLRRERVGVPSPRLVRIPIGKLLTAAGAIRRFGHRLITTIIGTGRALDADMKMEGMVVVGADFSEPGMRAGLGQLPVAKRLLDRLSNGRNY